MTAPPLTQPDLKRYRSSTSLTMRATPNELPAGVCGQIEGVALVYGVIDTYGTTFAKGCLDQTVRQRVAPGKVRLFLDHGDVPLSGMYDTHLHIGTVREVIDEQGPDGRWQARFRADLFDTEAGRRAHEYLRAVAATGSETGVSIGMLKEPATVRCKVDGQEALRIDEVVLGEISVTSMSAVPGTRVTAVRAEKVEPASDPATLTLSTSVNYFVLLDGIVAHLGVDAVRAHLGTTIGDAVMENRNAEHPHSDTDVSHSDSPGVSQGGTEPPLPNVVPMPERIAFLRSTYARDYSP